MTKKLTISKGGTDVKNDGTLLYSPNIIDFSSAEIVRGKRGDWDDFQLYGTSNVGESEYRSVGEDAEVSEELMSQIRGRRVVQKIRQLGLDLEAA